ncbi:MAG: hypothetical protein ACI9OJ_001945 [Myxococcota bacterium]
MSYNQQGLMASDDRGDCNRRAQLLPGLALGALLPNLAGHTGSMEDPVTPIPQIPREAWPTHPNYPGNVLLLGSHRNFRHISAQLVGHLNEEGAAAPAESLFRRWISAMRRQTIPKAHPAYWRTAWVLPPARQTTNDLLQQNHLIAAALSRKNTW